MLTLSCLRDIFTVLRVTPLSEPARNNLSRPVEVTLYFMSPGVLNAAQQLVDANLTQGFGIHFFHDDGAIQAVLAIAGRQVA